MSSTVGKGKRKCDDAGCAAFRLHLPDVKNAQTEHDQDQSTAGPQHRSTGGLCSASPADRHRKGKTTAPPANSKRRRARVFNAAQRLGVADKLLNRMIAFISGCVIVVTLLPVYFPVGPTATSAVSFFTIAFSIFILAMSLLQYSNSDPSRAEQHHRCGLELNSLRRELRSTHVTTEEQLVPFARRFDEILGRYSINHEDIDFERYKREHPDEYPDAPAARDYSEAPIERWVAVAGAVVGAATSALIAIVASAQLPTAVA